MSAVFSDFELDQMGLKFADKDAYVPVNCVGSCEETMETKVISKKCRGVVAKTRTKGTGAGSLKLTAHVPYDVYTEAYGMDLDTLKEGVKAYGQNSRHKEFGLVMHIMDEDGNEKLKAFPKCIMTNGVTRKIENGAEEVAELELELSVMPDEFGNGLYEALVSELTDETAKTTWMTAFTPELVQVESA
ncbi:MAG: hypothetical protein IKY91_05595 [Akkermansia sp.]|nr:hypothetical protein [Akkermansia sp.]